MIPFIVISYACFALCIVVVLLGRKGTEEDKNLRRMKTLGKDVVKADYKNVETSFYERNAIRFCFRLLGCGIWVRENYERSWIQFTRKKQFY